MFSKIYSASIYGVRMQKINVEVDISDGLPVFDMVGLLNSEVKESKERVRTAIKNTGVLLPPKRITVNLSPANLRKTGNYFDLPIAIGILKSLGIVYGDKLSDTLIIGELSLDGSVNKINGILSVVLDAKEHGFTKVILPKENEKEGGIAKEIAVYGVNNIKEAIELINNGFNISPYKYDITEEFEKSKNEYALDFADVRGQETTKRAAVIAACGMHHLLLIGPPGAGKSMIASRIPSILPKPDISECLEITRIHSVAGKLEGTPFLNKRPFRCPHHTITQIALVGGGSIPKPGEMTLAHRGVLFLDELAEFKKDTIDVLRQPLESGKITISRASGIYEFPASVMLVGATNPCKCGYYPDRSRCNCSQKQVDNYLGRISGPILDRIDICVNTPLIKLEELTDEKRSDMDSKTMEEMVNTGRKMQISRFGRNDAYNSDMNSNEVSKYCPMDKKAKDMLDMAYKKFKLSARAYYKIIKVARTIADIEQEEKINSKHITEALGYRLFR